MCNVRLYYFLLIVLFYSTNLPYTFSEVEIINGSNKALLIGYKSGSEVIDEGENAWRLRKKKSKSYNFNDSIWFTRRGDTTTGSFLSIRDWGKDNLEKIEVLDGSVNGVGYRVQVKPKNEGWYCFQGDGDKRCANTIHIHEKTKGVERIEKKLKKPFNKKKSLKFYPLTKSGKNTVIVEYKNGDSGMHIFQGNNNVKKLGMILKKRKSVLNFNNLNDSMIIRFTGKFNGEKNIGVLLNYDNWKDNKRILKIEKFSNRLLIHTVDNKIYCYGSKCKCKDIGLRLGRKTNKWPWGEGIEGNEAMPVVRTEFAACPAVLDIGLSEELYDKKIRDNEKNKMKRLYNEDKSLSHESLLKMDNFPRKATNVSKSDLIAISEIMELVNLKREKNDNGGAISDSENVLQLAKKLGWNRVKWLKSNRGLQLGIKKAAFVESRNHILMLGKIHHETKVGVIIISARHTARNLGWLNNLLAIPIRTKFYGFSKAISVHGSFHASMKSSWSGDSSDINEIKEDGGILETLNLWSNELRNKGAEDIQIIVTGHSQGGGMANLISAKLLGEGHMKRFADLFNVSDEDRLWLVTYGAPAVIKGKRGWDDKSDIHGAKVVENAISRDNILRFWASWDMVPVGAQKFDIAPYEHIGTSLMTEVDGGIMGYFLDKILKDNELDTEPIINAHSIDDYKMKQLIPLYLHNKYPTYRSIVKNINKSVRRIILRMMLRLLSKDTKVPINSFSRVNFPIYRPSNIDRK